MSATESTTMTLVMKGLPDWVFKWYKESMIWHNIVNEYETLNSNSSNCSQFKQDNSEEYDGYDKRDLALLLLNFQGSNVDMGEKRKPPQTIKTCNKCLKTYNVNSAKQKCKTHNCNGLLYLRVKKDNQPKRKAPKCTKYCNKCEKRFVMVPTALSKCNECGEKLSTIK